MQMRQKLKAHWKKIGIKVPEGTTFVKGDNGTYSFYAEQISDGEVMYDGSLVCEYNINNEIMSVDNQIIEYKKYKKVMLRSKKDAFEDIKSGKFQQYEKPEKIHIKNVTIGYEIDSKAFYQPVYKFAVAYNGGNEEEDVIIIPAIEK